MNHAYNNAFFAERAVSRLSSIPLEKSVAEGVQSAEHILAEVRHAASCAVDARDDGRLREAKEAILARLWANIIDPERPA